MSEFQKEIIKRSTQIYNYDSLVKLYGEKKAKEEYKFTENEIICMLGKGSGKDLMAEISCAYIVYKLLCLKDPAAYYGKPPGDAIDIINIAVNADQANRVFFKGFKNLITNSPWFAGKYDAKAKLIEFDKSITVHSGHSEMESFEGYNTIAVIMDEISGFSGPAGGLGEGDDEIDDPAQAIYNMFAASLESRFDEHGKLILLSFPRHKKDFITKRYNEVVAEKHSVPQSYTFILNPEFSPEAPGNSLTIEWTEDEIIRYAEDRVWAIRRPTWVINPTKTPESFKRRFIKNLADALGRFAAEPTDGASGFFNDHESIDQFSTLHNGIDENGVFEKWFTPDPDREYYMHVDLARKHDRAVVAMGSVHKWKREVFGGGASEVLPFIRIELIRYWTPTKTNQVDFAEIRAFIMSVARRGFNLRLVTFDQWESDEMMKYLKKHGLKSEKLSVGLQHYNDLKLMINEGRVLAPTNEILVTELKQLQITKNGKNVDHPRSGSKDIADAVCGAAWNAAALTSRPDEEEMEVLTAEDFRLRDAERNERARQQADQEIWDYRKDRDRMPESMPNDVELFMKVLGRG